ncbi:hypothetical protein GCM10022270_09610 [Terriglobus aquaticus]
MVVLRLALAPGIVWAAASGRPDAVLSVCVLIALLSDIYDGVIARRLGCDTPAIRVADSLVDTVFYLGVLAALWLRKAAVVRREWPLLAILLTLECVRYVVDLRKFGKSSSYHSYLAKTWGLVMAISLILVFAFSRGGLLLGIALVLGILCDVEGLAMSAILPQWQHDVKTIPRALALRRAMLAGK